MMWSVTFHPDLTALNVGTSERFFIMRRITLTAVAAAAAASLAITPVANAQQGNPLEVLGALAEGIGNADCGVIEGALNGLDLVDEDTTRGELVSDLNAYIGDDIALRLILGGNVNAIGDRALECGVVQEDPEQDLIAAILNSSEGNPLDTVTALSSAL